MKFCNTLASADDTPAVAPHALVVARSAPVVARQTLASAEDALGIAFAALTSADDNRDRFSGNLISLWHALPMFCRVFQRFPRKMRNGRFVRREADYFAASF